jgi:hypothetical protein
MPEHKAESSKFTSQLRLMRSMFGMVGEGAPRLSWCDEMEAIERSEAEARKRQQREECQKLYEKARQEALKHTHKLPRKLREDKKGYKPVGYLAKLKLHEETACRSSCKERGKLWKEELSSLTTLVGAVASLLTIIALSEGAEVLKPQNKCSKETCNTDTTGLVSLDDWLMMHFLLVIAVMIVTKIKKYLKEIQEAEGESLLMRKAGEAEPSTAGEGSGLLHSVSRQVGWRMQFWSCYFSCAAEEYATDAAFWWNSRK